MGTVPGDSVLLFVRHWSGAVMFSSVLTRYVWSLVPPLVAFIGVGRTFQPAVPHQCSVTFTRLLPLSVAFDHRVATGGQVGRFLKTMIDDLQKLGAERRCASVPHAWINSSGNECQDDGRGEQNPEVCG